jgi:hypothetical protein
MRLYCRHCKTEVITDVDMGDGTNLPECPICPDGEDGDERLIPIDDYETPEERRKRTGEDLPDNAAVYARDYTRTLQGLQHGAWEICSYDSAKWKKRNYGPVDIICAQGLPPPDDYGKDRYKTHDKG